MCLFGHKPLLLLHIWFLLLLFCFGFGLFSSDIVLLNSFPVPPSVGSWKLKSCRMFWFAQRHSRMDFQWPYLHFLPSHFQQGSVRDLRDAGAMKMKTGNYFRGLDWSTACPEKGIIFNDSGFIKTFVAMTVSHLFGNLWGYYILQFFVL